MTNIRTLVSDPAAYLKCFRYAGVRYLYKRNRRLLGHEHPERPLNDYLRRAVPVTLVYSRRCHPDNKQALTLKDIPSIQFLPVESARHNCLVELKRRGEIREFLRDVFSRFSFQDSSDNHKFAFEDTWAGPLVSYHYSFRSFCLGRREYRRIQNSRETGRFVAWLRGYRDHRQFFWNFFASSRFYKEGTSIISFP